MQAAGSVTMNKELNLGTFTRRDIIIQKLQQNGFKITKQRICIIDVLLREQCANCKEIYYKASQIDPKIGTATVYRVLNMLEEIKIIERLDSYRFMNVIDEEKEADYRVVMQDESQVKLNSSQMKSILRAGLAAYGYNIQQKASKIVLNDCCVEL